MFRGRRLGFHLGIGAGLLALGSLPFAGAAQAASEFMPHFVGEQGVAEAGDTHVTRPMGSARAVSQQSDDANFDNSRRIVPPQELPYKKPPATRSLTPSQDIIRNHQTRAITREGRVEMIDVPPELEKRILDGIRKIEEERRSSIPMGQPHGRLAQEDSQARSRTVFDLYERTPVLNTKVFPFRTVGLVGFEAGGCTGTLIGPRHVLTAGHCIYNIKSNKWYRNVEFYAGRSGSYAPYGSMPWKRLLSVKCWTDFHQEDCDFGLMILDSPIGDRVGWVGFGYEDPMPKYKVNIIGYPSDKPSATMWHSFCPLEGVADDRLTYKCDTASGTSGSGILVYFSGDRTNKIYGVNSYEVPDGSYPNFGPRINKTRFELIRQWKLDNP